jgi:prepilin peptidase CpaA
MIMNEYALVTSVLVALLILSVALYLDLRYQRIPNQLCLVALLSGIIINTYSGALEGLLMALSGAAIAMIILLPAYIFRFLGAGDVKLMIGIGALSGPLIITWSIAYAIIFGAFTSLLIATKKVGWNGVKTTFSRYFDCVSVGHYFKPETGEAAAMKVPYAPALTLGWLLANYLNLDVSNLLLTIESSLSHY